ncbi:MAG: type IV pilus biogenesis/stability protein PilW [Spongiibacteraceae bacterium]
MNRLTRCLLLAGVLLSLTLVSACVTTETGGFSTKQDKKKSLDYSVQLAMTYIRNGNWEAAKRHLKTALEIDNSSADVYEALAIVFQQTGENELAETNFKKSISLDGSLSRVRNNYAAFLYQQSRYEEAVKQLELVVEDTLYEKRPGAYENLGLAYVQLKKYDKAEAAFRRAYLMNKRNVGLVYQLADVYFLMGEYPKSQQFYDAYRKQVTQQPAQALWLGIRLAEKFDNQDAIASFALALKNLYPMSKELLEYNKTYGSGNE